MNPQKCKELITDLCKFHNSKVEIKYLENNKNDSKVLFVMGFDLKEDIFEFQQYYPKEFITETRKEFIELENYYEIYHTLICQTASGQKALFEFAQNSDMFFKHFIEIKEKN